MAHKHFQFDNAGNIQAGTQALLPWHKIMLTGKEDNHFRCEHFHSGIGGNNHYGIYGTMASVSSDCGTDGKKNSNHGGTCSCSLWLWWEY